MLSDQDRTSTAMALEDCTVWVIGGQRFLDFLSVHFEATRELLRTLARQIHAHESFVEDLLFLDLKGRVAKRLLQLVAPSLDQLPPDRSVVPAVVPGALRGAEVDCVPSHHLPAGPGRRRRTPVP